MLMKVFQKGQIVIPAGIRHELHIEPGDMLDVSVEKNGSIIIKKPESSLADELAGSLAEFGRKKEFPSKKEMKEALAKGLSHGE